MACMRERITQFLKYQPRNKLVFTPSPHPHLNFINVGFQLSNANSENLDSPQRPLIQVDNLLTIIRHSTNYLINPHPLYLVNYAR